MSSSNAGLSLGSHYQGTPGANDRVEEGCTHQKVPPIMLTLRHQLCRTGRMNTADRADVQRSSMVTLQREKRRTCNTFAATELSQKAVSTRGIAQRIRRDLQFTRRMAFSSFPR